MTRSASSSQAAWNSPKKPCKDHSNAWHACVGGARFFTGVLFSEHMTSINRAVNSHGYLCGLIKGVAVHTVIYSRLTFDGECEPHMHKANQSVMWLTTVLAVSLVRKLAFGRRHAVLTTNALIFSLSITLLQPI